MSLSDTRRGRDPWHWLGRQLARPDGSAARWIGAAMALVNRAPYRLAFESLAPSPDQRVLEVGFGPGAGLAALAARLPLGHVCGIDASPAMLRQAARRNARVLADGRLELRTGDARYLPWRDGAFDAVFAVNVAYFFDRGGATMSELRRVLAPGGRLVIYVTDRDTMARWRFAGPETHATYDAAALRQLFRAGGFAAERTDVTAHRLRFGIGGLIGVARAN